MGARAAVVVGAFAALALAACGSGEGAAPTSTSGTTVTTPETTRPPVTSGGNGKTEPVTNATVPAKFEVGVKAKKDGNVVTFTVDNTGEQSLVSGVVTIELRGAVSGEGPRGDCGGQTGELACDMRSFKPGNSVEVVVVLEEPTTGPGASTTTGRAVATVRVQGEGPGGKPVNTSVRVTV